MLNVLLRLSEICVLGEFFEGRIEYNAVPSGLDDGFQRSVNYFDVMVGREARLGLLCIGFRGDVNRFEEPLAEPSVLQEIKVLLAGNVSRNGDLFSSFEISDLLGLGIGGAE